jgi:Fe-S-cluster containining protein
MREDPTIRMAWLPAVSTGLGSGKGFQAGERRRGFFSTRRLCKIVPTMGHPSDNPCLSCGACCMSFRVSFYWSEALELALPEALTEQVAPHLACMAGTNSTQPYCVALGRGEAGPMACGVYAQRPSPCREVQIGDDKCNRARSRCGMPPI